MRELGGEETEGDNDAARRSKIKQYTARNMKTDEKKIATQWNINKSYIIIEN